MCRLIYPRLLFPGLPLLLACCLSPVFGDDNAGQSTWKIVASSESSGEATMPSQDSSSVWDESYTSPSVPLPRPAAESPVTTAVPTVPTAPLCAAAPTPTVPATPAPAERFRPLIPSRLIEAANRGEVMSAPLSDEQVRTAIGYNGLEASSQTQSQVTQTAAIAPVSQPSHRQGKPFQTLMRDPTINPWLNLDRQENYEELPNYFTFVRPQVNQIDTNRRYQSDITHLQRQVQTVTTAVAGPQYGPGGVPPTGHRARYMDTAQFYGRWGN